MVEGERERERELVELREMVVRERERANRQRLRLAPPPLRRHHAELSLPPGHPCVAVRNKPRPRTVYLTHAVASQNAAGKILTLVE